MRNIKVDALPIERLAHFPLGRNGRRIGHQSQSISLLGLSWRDNHECNQRHSFCTMGYRWGTHGEASVYPPLVNKVHNRAKVHHHELGQTLVTHIAGCTATTPWG